MVVMFVQIFETDQDNLHAEDILSAQVIGEVLALLTTRVSADDQVNPVNIFCTIACIKRVVCHLCSQHLKSAVRSEEHTSELQSLMRISYAVFCLKNKNQMIQT